jgi:hypothetical protein
MLLKNILLICSTLICFSHDLQSAHHVREKVGDVRLNDPTRKAGNANPLQTPFTSF